MVRFQHVTLGCYRVEFVEGQVRKSAVILGHGDDVSDWSSVSVFSVPGRQTIVAVYIPGRGLYAKRGRRT